MFCKAACRCPATLVTRTTLPAKGRGFTLVEMLVAVVVAMVLAALALPDLSEVTTKNALRNEAEALVTSLKAARTEAIRADTTVSICASNLNSNVSTNVSTPTCGTNWSNGWVVFVDPGFGQNLTTSNAADVRNLRIPTTSQVTTTLAGATIPDNSGGSTSAAAISFQPNGESFSQLATFSLTAPATGTLKFRISIAVHPSGQIVASELTKS